VARRSKLKRSHRKNRVRCSPEYHQTQNECSSEKESNIWKKRIGAYICDIFKFGNLLALSRIVFNFFNDSPKSSQ
jgi:hypothetical protein